MSERCFNAFMALDDLVNASHAVAVCNFADSRATALAYQELCQQIAIATALLAEDYPYDDERPIDQRRSQLLHGARDYWRRRRRWSKHPVDAVFRNALKRRAPALRLVPGDAA